MEIIQLNGDEKSRLAELEQLIEENMVGWINVGFALKEIQELRLYRTTHASFESYVKARFDVAKATAYQYIQGAIVFDTVRNCGHELSMLPEKESQARPLTRLSSEEAADAWIRSLDLAREEELDTVPARIVERVVRNLRGEPIKEIIRNTETTIRELPSEYRAAFHILSNQIREARKNRFKGIDKNRMLQLIDSLRKLFED